MKKLAVLTIAVLLIGLRTNAGPQIEAGGYTLIDLSTNGDFLGGARLINAAGHALGNGYDKSFNYQIYRAFLFTGALPLVGLPPVSPFLYATGNGLNDFDDVVGYVATDEGTTIRAVASIGGAPPVYMTGLGSLISYADAINNSREIVGAYEVAAGYQHAFISHDGNVIDIHPFLSPHYGSSGTPVSTARDINDFHMVAGWMGPFSNSRAYRYKSPIDVEVLPGANGKAWRMNDNGEITGTVDIVANAAQPVMWSADNQITYFGPPGQQGTAFGINNNGQVTGTFIVGGGFRAFLYSGGAVIDLNTLLPPGLGWVLSTASDINDKGQIVGTFFDGVNQFRPFLMNPNTPGGANVVAMPVDQSTGTSPVTMTFSNVTQGGGTTLTISDTGPAVPSGFTLGTPARYYELSTIASFAGGIQVCIDFTGVDFGASTPALMHYEGGTWVDVTTSTGPGNEICGAVTSLSPFALFAPIPQRFVVQLLYDPAKPATAGSTIPIKLQIDDAEGVNVSSAALPLTAVGDVSASGHANPDLAFRYDAALGGSGGYVFNLKTDGLASGEHTLEFTVGSDTFIYSAPFQVK